MAEEKKDFSAGIYSDTPKDGIKAEDKIRKAILLLLRRYPFFGKLAMFMVTIRLPKEVCPTTAVDKKGRLYWCREWVNGLTLEDMVFEIGHETMHLVQRTFARSPKGVIHPIWNLASDWLCDLYLAEAGLTQSCISKKMLPPDKLKKAKELGTIEKVYQHLLEEVKNNTSCQACKEMIEKIQNQEKKEDVTDKKESSQSPSDKEDQESGKGDAEGQESSKATAGNGKGNGEGEGKGNGEGTGKHSHGTPHTCGNVRQCCAGITADGEGLSPYDNNKWQQNIIAAKMYADSKDRGNIPGNFGEMIDGLVKPKVKWQNYLRKTSHRIFGNGRLTYKAPNRRGFGVKVRLPKRQPENKSAVIVVDSSGSVSTEQLRQTVAESLAIMKQTGAEKILLVLHDVIVYYMQEITAKDVKNLKFRRGGTSHLDVFKCLNGESDKWKLPKGYTVELVVCFTDLETQFPRIAPSYSVLWGVFETGRKPHPAPFGQVITVPVSKD